MVTSEASKEAVWIRKFISEVGVVPSIKGPIDLYCDNNGAITQAREPREHQKVKHVQRRFHMIREWKSKGEIKICKIDMDDNIADALTKPFPQVKHNKHVEAMGIKNVEIDFEIPCTCVLIKLVDLM